MLKTFDGIATYPIDSTWRVEATFEPNNPPKIIAIPTILNTIDEEPSPGAFVFKIDGKAIIDFNKAYNPPCAFTEYATCPLPPEQNKLPVRITAGEKKYAHAAH